MRKILLLLLLISGKSIGQTLESDRLALVAFYQATGGNNWYDNTGWVVPGNPGDNPCGWFGVNCEGGRVTSLVIEENDIVAPIPAAIGNLSALKHLDLSGAGAEFDYFFGDLPVELANLSNLEYLDLSGNQLSGVNVSVINNLTKLKHLSLSPYENWLSIPSFANLTKLEYLRLEVESSAMLGHGVIGAIPAYLGSFTKLKTLIMRFGGLTGTIPSNLGNLTDLEVLDLSLNELTGSIPASFNNLTKLTKLDLSYNSLTGPIPNILGIPVSADVRINNNAFNFSGMETNISRLDAYGNQKKFKLEVEIALGGDEAASLYAEHAGGTASNNTYKWYKDGTLFRTTTNGGNYIVVPTGVYRVEVTNSLVPGLTLVSGDEVIAAMPVTLVSFDGKHESNQTKLTWKTTSETNNKGFEIERSADARTFEKIGFVDGSGDTKEDQFYHFTDLDPLTIGYYRLKQLDYDGKFEYSKVISVKRGGAIVKIYPNPAQTELTVEGAAENESVSVFTPTGRLVVADAKLSGGKLDVKDLKEGIYTIKIGDVAKKLLIKR